MTIAAIQTSYAGCRFRSRLEARWAVFFDRIGIRWLYEPQGFIVGDAGRPYLPDFYLPDDGLWVEVKGDERALDLSLICDAVVPHFNGLPASPDGDLPRDTSRLGDRMLVLGAIPRPVGRPVHSCLSFWKGDVLRHWVEFAAGQVVHRYRGTEDLVGRDDGTVFSVPLLVNGGYVDGCAADYVLDAYVAARSARFEHGERP